MKKLFKRVLCLIFVVLFVFGGCSVVSPEEVTTTETTTQVVETTTQQALPQDTEEGDSNSEGTKEEVTISNEVIDLVEDTKDAVDNKEDVATSDVFESSYKEEENTLTEEDGTVEYENIAYNGAGQFVNGLDLLSPYVGRTYYSQMDSRWGHLLYTSCGNKSQTIKSSGCGPTSAAMVVSSMIGTIEPPAMAKLFVDNGFRTRNNGTAWSAWRFVADTFKFDDYAELTKFDNIVKYLNKDANGDGVGDYMIVVSCAPGLFTTSGHYIVIFKLNVHTNIVNFMDPYDYTGKFNTASRRIYHVTKSGNIGSLTEANLRAGGKINRGWAFKGTPKKKTTSDNVTKTQKDTAKFTPVKYTRYVATSGKGSTLNVRLGPSTSYSIVSSLAYGSAVKIIGVSTNGKWGKISDNHWVSMSYLSSTPVVTEKVEKTQTTSTVKYKTDVGKSYKFKSYTVLYSKGTLSGTQYNYKPGTTAKVISHYSDSVDYIYIASTGRYAYVKVSAFKIYTTSTAVTTKSTVGQHKRLARDTTLYSKSNLTGTKYQYYALTELVIIKNISSKVDYIEVVKTGRRAYVSTSQYK